MTSIEWTDETWNPVTGCDRCSPGCDNCYALTLAKRLKAMGSAHYQLDGDPRTSGPGFAVQCHEDALDIPLRWRKPRMVFVNSMSDLFHPDVPDGFIVAVWEVMRQCPQHTFQILTKRPQRMASFVSRWHDVTGEDFVPKLARGSEATRAAHPSPKGQLWAEYLDVLGEPPEGCAYPTFDWMEGPLRMLPTDPLPNVWLGVSIENDVYSFRAKHLRKTPAAVRFVSAEPLLGPLPSLDLTGIDWLILGGESGPGARPMHPEWARELRDRCPDRRQACEIPDVPLPHSVPVYEKGRMVGGRACACSYADPVAFFFKQWGDWGPAGSWRGPDHHMTIDGQLFNPGEFPGKGWPVAIHRWGKKASGRVLDGRTWDEYPRSAA